MQNLNFSNLQENIISSLNSTTSTQQQQDETTAQLNKLLQQSSQALSCGPDCQKEQKMSELKQNYINAQTNLESAPVVLSTAEKDYYTYTQGTAGYNKIINSELEKKATILTDVLFKNFNNSIADTTHLVDIYSNLSNNYSHINELYKDYIAKNKDLKYKIQLTNSNILTDDRKTFYEIQQIQHLKNWHTFFKWIYFIGLIIFVIVSLRFYKTQSPLRTIIIFIFLCIYPYIFFPIWKFIHDAVVKEEPRPQPVL